METTTVTCPKCGSSNYRVEQRNIHQTAFCNDCDSYIKNLPQGKPTTLFFGKYNGRTLDSMIDAEEIRYLKWLATKPDLKPNSLKTAIDAFLIGK
jgi:uncharacterized protein (DUF3820 family)